MPTNQPSTLVLHQGASRSSKESAKSANALKTEMATGKPEDVFHRVVREEGYWGRYQASESDNGLDGFISDADRLMNDSFADQKQKLLTNVGHPDLYFGVIEGDEVNALALIEDGWAMVGITNGLFASLYSLLAIACQDHDLVQGFEVEASIPGASEIFVLLYITAINFAANHELGHLVHGHCSSAVANGPRTARKEVVPHVVAAGRLRSQAEEVEADGYATHMTLQNLLNGPAREAAARQLGVPTDHPRLDERLLKVFLTAVICFFHRLHNPLVADDVESSSHPFELLRINVVITNLQGWCATHRPQTANWPNQDEFVRLGRVVRHAVRPSGIEDTWDTQNAFLGSDAGQKYRDRLYQERESLRKQMEPMRWQIVRG